MGRLCIAILVLVVKSQLLQAQDLVFFDKETNLRLTQVVLYSTLNSPYHFTVRNGSVRIDSSLPDTLFVYALGYNRHRTTRDSLLKIDSFGLQPLSYELRGVEVIDDGLRQTLTLEHGKIGVNALEVAKLPVLFSEPDLLKSIQLLPGVSSVMENNVVPFIRGGKGAHTAICIDGATLYNPSHSVGFFSVVHPAAAQSTNLVYDRISGEYGGRASAFLDIQLKEGSNKNWKGTSSIGLISSYLDIQGPLKKGRRAVSLQFVGRTTYIDKFVELLNGEDEARFSTGFSDLSTKLSWNLDEAKKLTVSFYSSNDQYRFNDLNLLSLGNQTDWKNQTLSTVFTNNSGSKWFKKTSISTSRYSLLNTLQPEVEHRSSIRDIKFKRVYQAQGLSDLVQAVGFETSFYHVNPGELSINSQEFYNYGEFSIANQRALDIAPFIDLKRKLAANYSFNANFRLSTFLRGEAMFVNPEPRLSIEKRTMKGSISLSYDRLAQNLRLYSANITPMPTDVWITSGEGMRPILMDGLTLGYLRNMGGSKYALKTAVYYRDFKNLGDVVSGASTFTTPDFQSDMKYGRAKAIGLEFLLQKTKGFFTGWLSYTLSRTQFTIKEINEGKPYNAPYDKPHILNIVANKKYEKYEINAVFVLQSGRPITLATEGVGVIRFFSDRNKYRLPTYHRLDLSVIRYQKRKKHHQGSWMFSVYNVYNRKNIFTAMFNPYTGRNTAITLFPILPSISYKLSFF